MGTEQGHTDEGPPLTVTLDDLVATARANRLPDAVIARCSTLFLFNLWETGSRLGWNQPFVAMEVLAEEGLHPGLRGLKKPDWFRGPELRGLWKRHFYDGSFVAENVRVALDSGAMNEELWELLRPTRRRLGESESEYALRLSRDVAALALHHGYAERKRRRRLSGEWIIYAKHPAGNHYLCLATHKEGDAGIRERIVQGVVPQFPFVGELLHVPRAD